MGHVRQRKERKERRDGGLSWEAPRHKGGKAEELPEPGLSQRHAMRAGRSWHLSSSLNDRCDPGREMGRHTQRERTLDTILMHREGSAWPVTHSKSTANTAPPALHQAG